MSEALELVNRLSTAIEAGDLETVQRCYSPDVVVWANFDGKARGLDSSLRLLDWLLSGTTDRSYEIVRRIEIEGGVLQQHVLHGTATTGKEFAMPACLVIRVDDGLITRLDEYLDPAAMATAFDPS